MTIQSVKGTWKMGPFIITAEQKNNTDFESFQKHYVTYILNANKSDLTLCMLGILLMIFCCLLIFPIFFHKHSFRDSISVSNS